MTFIRKLERLYDRIDWEIVSLVCIPIMSIAIIVLAFIAFAH